LGDDFLALKKGEDAIDSFQEQLRLAEAIGDRHMEMRALGRLGAAYKLLREYNHAIQVQKRSLTIAEELGDMEGQADEFFNLARTKFAIGDRSSAIEFGETARAIYEQIESPLAQDVRCAVRKWCGNSAQPKEGKSPQLA
jgi:tetratricopeptide (TPR) repeat protein